MKTALAATEIAKCVFSLATLQLCHFVANNCSSASKQHELVHIFIAKAVRKG